MQSTRRGRYALTEELAPAGFAGAGAFAPTSRARTSCKRRNTSAGGRAPIKKADRLPTSQMCHNAPALWIAATGTPELTASALSPKGQRWRQNTVGVEAVSFALPPHRKEGNRGCLPKRVCTAGGSGDCRRHSRCSTRTEPQRFPNGG